MLRSLSLKHLAVILCSFFGMFAVLAQNSSAPTQVPSAAPTAPDTVPASPSTSSPVPVLTPALEPVLALAVDHAILRLGKDQPAKTAISVKPLHFPDGATLTYDWKQVQDEMLHGSARMDAKPIHFSATDSQSIEATFPDKGVYEIRVTVTDAAHNVSASRNTWINVWDNKPALQVNGQADPLTIIPGMTPPKVRNVTPEPGPFVHPRLYCSPDDWKDIHARAVEGQSKVAAAGWRPLFDRFDKGINPNSPDGKLLAQIEAYEDAGGQAPLPDLTEGQNDPNVCGKVIIGLSQNLAGACFEHWLKIDPAQPQSAIPPEDLAACKKLAKQVSQSYRFLLDNSWDRKTGKFKTDAVGYIKNLESPAERIEDTESFAVAYDFIAPWMTEDQRRDTRNLLIAIGRGRKGPGLNSVNHNVDQSSLYCPIQRNGTFTYWGEPAVVTGLVVAGEESGADPMVVQTFLNPPKPTDEDKAPTVDYDLVQPVEFDGGGKLRISRPYPPSITWPHALKCEVSCLHKEVATLPDDMITPWGFTLERIAYFGFITEQTWPTAYVYTRFGGFNQFVGCPYYQTVNNFIYTLYPSGGTNSSTSFSNNIGMYEHHTGGGDYRQQMILFLKHMYPDDPVVDYAYMSQVPDMEKRAHFPINSCIFGVDPVIKDYHGALEPIAKSHELPLTKLDPQLGIVAMRSGWKDDDLMVYLDGGHPMWGHMNAEHGSFSLLALGRHWSIPSGYHKVLGNFQSLIQVQNPDWAACPTTQGYMTENPCYKPDVPDCDYYSGFPTPSAHLLEVKEAPDQHWSMAATDVTTCYNFTCGAPKDKQTTIQQFDLKDFMYPGLANYWLGINSEYANWWHAGFAPVPASCAIQRAIRTILFMRGTHPYCLVVDDFKKNDKPANYRWTMNDKTKMKDENRVTDPKDNSFCLTMAPGATPTQAVLLNQWDTGDKPGLPRLLVRDLSENDNSSQPVMRMQQTHFHLPEAKYSQEDTNALVIERDQVVAPRFKVLLFPFRTGDKLPTTTWNKKRTELRIHFHDGAEDTVVFDSTNPDHRTRVSVK